ncbi:hypothetical protein, partial [Aeromonas hydrophila]|uniref:hypothetical protein n=1 Tax=Aeromonas hydrophila TaxID=644 RepID=UPI003BA08344
RSLTRGIGKLLRLLDPGLSDLVRTPQVLANRVQVLQTWLGLYCAVYKYSIALLQMKITVDQMTPDKV